MRLFAIFFFIAITLTSCATQQNQIDSSKIKVKCIENKEGVKIPSLLSRTSVCEIFNFAMVPSDSVLHNSFIPFIIKDETFKTDNRKDNFMKNFWIILGIIFISGIFGGIVSYFIEWKKTLEDKTGYRFFLKCIISGLAASFIVPLFLNTISSTLIEKSMNIQNMQNLDYLTNYLLVAGFCLTASIFSQKFISAIGNKLIKDLENKLEDTKEEWKEDMKGTKDVVFNLYKKEHIEGEEIESKNRETIVQNLENRLKLPIRTIVKALDTSEDSNKYNENKFKLRTIKGIVKSTINISEEDVLSSLKELNKHGVVTKISNSKGKLYWTLNDPIKYSNI